MRAGRSQEGGAAQADQGVGERLKRAPGNDLLRLERFGALYYARAEHAYWSLDSNQAALLLDLTAQPWSRAARDPRHLRALGGKGLAELRRIWRRRGWLDRAGSCSARVLWQPAPPGGLTAPLKTNVQLTARCNLRCPHCYVDRATCRRGADLPLDRVEALFAGLAAMGAPYVVLSGGEPTLRPDLPEIAQLARRHGIDAKLCTNAVAIDRRLARALARAGWAEISVSLDGPDATTHDALRGSKAFERTCAGIRELVAADAPPVSLRVTVSKLNCGSLSRFERLARDLNVARVLFRPFRPNSAADLRSPLYLTCREYARWRERARRAWPERGVPAEFSDRWAERGPHLPRYGCLGGNASLVVTERGDVLPCGTAPIPRPWNLRDHPIREIWLEDPHLQRWRSFKPPAPCARCRHLSRCGGGCRIRAWSFGRGIAGLDAWACAREAARERRARDRASDRAER